MIVKWPGFSSIKSAETVYTENERSDEGRYPVGKNKLWHSGIHIEEQKIYPMIEGWLVAYYLSSEDTKLERKEITSAEYEHLSEREKYIYLEASGKYKPDHGEQYEKFAKSFFLIRHRVALPITAENKTPSPLEFFTLYANIAALKQRYNEYQPLDSFKDNWEIPFYERYIFHVVDSPACTNKYIVKGSQEILIGQRCEFKYKDGQDYYCRFLTGDGKGDEVVISKDYMEIIKNGAIEEKPEYITPVEGVQLYKLNMRQTDIPEEHKAGTLKMGRRFRNVFDFCKVGDVDFVKIRVNKDEMASGEKEHVATLDGTPNFIVQFSALSYNNKPGAGLLRDSIAPNGTVKGIPFYISDNIKHGILGIKKPEESFEFEDHSVFWKNYKEKSEQFIALKRGNALERKKYLHFIKNTNAAGDAEQDMEAKIERRGEYEMDKTVICEAAPEHETELLLDHDSLLGEPKYHISPSFSYYDLVLLFSNTDFLRERLDWKSSFMILRNADPSLASADSANDNNFITYIIDSCKGIIKKITDFIFPKKEEEASEKNETSADKQYPDIPPDDMPNEAELQRKLICQHALEWDKDLYFQDGTIRPYCHKYFGVPNTNNDKEEFKKQIEAIDIWDGLKDKTIDGLDLKENNFCFAHPVYFINHLYSEGLLTEPRIRNLIKVQDKIIKLKCLQPNTDVDMYGNTGNGNTFCNHAAFLTVIATDGRYDNFTGQKKLNPQNDFTAYTFPETKDPEIYTKDGIIVSNFWCDELERLKNAGLLTMVDPKEAQLYGNMGYTVIASYRATNKDEKIKKDYHPHFATVRPGFEFNKDGPMVANVGANNLIQRAGNSLCFGKDRYEKTKWYYNPNQEFRLDTRWIKYLEEKHR